MAKDFKAVRGATTLDTDTPENMRDRIGELLERLVDENNILPSDILNIFFTATSDIVSTYPATAARAACEWLSDIALFGAQEQEVEKGMPLCVRVLIQFFSKEKQVRHIYLHEAKNLRKQ